MQLTLVRHGEAAPPVNGNDSKRPLTERGHQQAEQTAQYLKDIIKPEVFVVSPLLRAQETLAHLQHYFKDVPVVICNTSSLMMMLKLQLNGCRSCRMSPLRWFVI
jgi:Phosphohistidine phosphatase SixA